VAILVGIVVVRNSTLVQVWVNDLLGLAKAQISPETRIKQLRLEIAKIDNDVKAAANKVVEVEMDRSKLRDEVEALKGTQKVRKDELKVLVEALEAGTSRVSFGSATYTGEGVQERLESLRVLYETGKETLKVKEQVLRSKTDQLEAADQRIGAIRGKKQRLLLLVEQLEADLERVRLKQVENSIEVNDSHVQEAEKLAQELKDRIAKEELRAEKYKQYGITSPAAQKTPDRASREDSLKSAKALLADEDGVK